MGKPNFTEEELISLKESGCIEPDKIPVCHKSIPTIKVESLEPKQINLDGNFEFKISDKITYTMGFVPVRDISFGWSPELIQDLSSLQKDNELFELLADKLKQDFLQFLIDYK